MEITTEQAKEYYKNKFKKTLSKDMIHEYASEFANHILKESKESLKEDNSEMIIIPKWKFNTIENALRMTNNIYNLHTKKTAYDREAFKAYEYAQRYLNNKL